MVAALFIVVGVVAGTVHARMLARAAAQVPHPLALALRFSLVACVLVTAAVTSHLFAAAGGWAAGFAVAAVISHRRLA
jgi:hypothetical protein